MSEMNVELCLTEILQGWLETISWENLVWQLQRALQSQTLPLDLPWDLSVSQGSWN